MNQQRRTEQERVAKLPQWAQNIYYRDQADLRDLREKAYGLASEGMDAIAVTRYGEPDRGFPSDTRLSWRLTDDLGERFGRLDIHHEGDHIEVYGVGELTTDTIRIEGRSSNRIVLTLVPHDERLRNPRP